MFGSACAKNECISFVDVNCNAFASETCMWWATKHQDSIRMEGGHDCNTHVFFTTSTLTMWNTILKLLFETAAVRTHAFQASHSLCGHLARQAAADCAKLCGALAERSVR